MQSEQMTGVANDYAERGISYAREQWDAVIGQTEDYVRENPTRALCYGVAAGFLLDRLPIFRLFGFALRLLLVALKPAMLIYGVTKVYQAIRDNTEA